MADRYWVGGSAVWNTTNTSVWSTSSGGSSGASVPTSSDNVFFDQPAVPPAPNISVSVSPGAVCANITVSAGTHTFQSTAPTIYGNVNLISSTIWNLNFTFGGTGSYTLTTNGVSGKNLLLSSACTVTLGSALTLTSGFTYLPSGSTFNTNGYSLSCGYIQFAAGDSGTINFGSSLVTVATLASTSLQNVTMTSSPGAVLSITTPTANPVIKPKSGNYMPALRFSGSGLVTIDNSCTYQDISSSYVGAKTFKFTAGTTNTFVAFNLRGTSGNLYTITSSSTSAATLKKAGKWYMGTNSTDSGNNTDLTFSGGSGIDYLNVSYITGVSVGTDTGWFFLR
jgi:hypothetical protein